MTKMRAYQARLFTRLLADAAGRDRDTIQELRGGAFMLNVRDEGGAWFSVLTSVRNNQLRITPLVTDGRIYQKVDERRAVLSPVGDMAWVKAQGGQVVVPILPTSGAVPSGIWENGKEISPLAELFSILAKKLVEMMLKVPTDKEGRDSDTPFCLADAHAGSPRGFLLLTSFSQPSWEGIGQPELIEALSAQVKAGKDPIPYSVKKLDAIASQSRRIRKGSTEFRSALRLLETTLRGEASSYWKVNSVDENERGVVLVRAPKTGSDPIQSMLDLKPHVEAMAKAGLMAWASGGETASQRALRFNPHTLYPFAIAPSKGPSFFNSVMAWTARTYGPHGDMAISKGYRALQGGRVFWAKVRIADRVELNNQGFLVDINFANRCETLITREVSFVPHELVVDGVGIPLTHEAVASLRYQELPVRSGKLHLGTMVQGGIVENVMKIRSRDHSVTVMEATLSEDEYGVKRVRLALQWTRLVGDYTKLFLGSTKGTCRTILDLDGVDIQVDWSKVDGKHMDYMSLFVSSVVQADPSILSRVMKEVDFTGDWRATFGVTDDSDPETVLQAICLHYGVDRDKVDVTIKPGVVEMMMPCRVDSHLPENVVGTGPKQVFTHLATSPRGAMARFQRGLIDYDEVEELLKALTCEYQVKVVDGKLVCDGHELVEVTHPLKGVGDHSMVFDLTQQDRPAVWVDGIFNPDLSAVEVSLEQTLLHPDEDAWLVIIIRGGSKTQVSAAPDDRIANFTTGIIGMPGRAIVIPPAMRKALGGSLSGNAAHLFVGSDLLRSLNELVDKGHRLDAGASITYGAGADATLRYSKTFVDQKVADIFGTVKVESVTNKKGETKEVARMDKPGTWLIAGFHALQDLVHPDHAGACVMVDMDPRVAPDTIVIDPLWLRKRDRFFSPEVDDVVVYQRPPLEPENGALALRVVAGPRVPKTFDDPVHTVWSYDLPWLTESDGPRAVINSNVGVHYARADRDGDLGYLTRFTGVTADAMMRDHSPSSHLTRLAAALAKRGMVMPEVNWFDYHVSAKHTPLAADRFSIENMIDHVLRECLVKAGVAYTCARAEYLWRMIGGHEDFGLIRDILLSLLKNGSVDKYQKVIDSLYGISPMRLVMAANGTNTSLFEVLDEDDDWKLDPDARAKLRHGRLVKALAGWSDAPTDEMAQVLAELAAEAIERLSSLTSLIVGKATARRMWAFQNYSGDEGPKRSASNMLLNTFGMGKHRGLGRAHDFLSKAWDQLGVDVTGGIASWLSRGTEVVDFRSELK